MDFARMTLPDITFEYNDFPVNKVQTIWFKHWMTEIRSQFDQKKTNYWRQEAKMKSLVELYVESANVSVL